DGTRVLDLADATGALCGRILADLGADVVKVEPPAGDPTRRLPPFLGDRETAETSVWWQSLNANKRGIALDVVADRDAFLRLARVADVIVETFAPRARPFTRADIGPHPVLVSITPYGQDGPSSGAPASDLELTAASGCLWLAGELGRPPVRTSLPQSGSWTGMYAAAGALTALLAREPGGAGQDVDVSAQHSLVGVHEPAAIFSDVLGEEHGRPGPFLQGRSLVGSRFRNVWPCRDGYLAYAIQGGTVGRHTGRELTEWMRSSGHEAPRLAAIDWDRFDNRTLPQSEVDALEMEIGGFLATLTKREFYDGVFARDMLGYPVSTAADLLTEDQLRARDFWQRVELADAGSFEMPGGFALFDGVRPRIERDAPRIAEHQDEVLAEWLR
ncbi:MAG: CoA transferase, partial [Chloroflexi bacterium]|nr:CoA transferase [Chloroflexota bacterium]